MATSTAKKLQAAKKPRAAKKPATAKKPAVRKRRVVKKEEKEATESLISVKDLIKVCGNSMDSEALSYEYGVVEEGDTSSVRKVTSRASELPKAFGIQAISEYRFNAGYSGKRESVGHLTDHAGRAHYLPLTAVLRQSKAVNERFETSTIASRIRTNRKHLVIGSDPEVFVVDSKGELIPAFEFLPSAAKARRNTDAYGNNIPAIYWDGYQAEFAPGNHQCQEGHWSKCYAAMGRILEEACKKFPGASISPASVAHVSYERLEKDAEEHVAFGCSPSLNAYGEDPVVPPEPRLYPIRTAGGHIHLNLPTGTISTKDGKAEFVRRLDAVLGVLSVGLFQKFDDPRRRAIYGRAGEYRDKTYGVEYRVLSNAWASSALPQHIVFELARRVMGMPDSVIGMYKFNEQEVRDCINNCDVSLMRKIVGGNKRFFAGLMASLPGANAYIVDGWLDIFDEGIDPPTQFGVDGGSCYRVSQTLIAKLAAKETRAAKAAASGGKVALA